MQEQPSSQLNVLTEMMLASHNGLPFLLLHTN